MKLNQAVILAGGRGERLRPLTDRIPKPMTPINGRPFLDFLIHSIIQAGIENILFLLGYKANVIVERYKSMKICGRNNVKANSLSLTRGDMHVNNSK